MRKLLDLFSGAGGSAVGYYRAGFEVVGVDNRPMPRYPFEFHQADAFEYLAEHGHEFDVIHASPPCQRYSKLAHVPNRDMDHYPDLIDQLRIMLVHTGKPWIIENVVGAPLATTIELCGTMFGLRVYRHRRFESNILLWQPEHKRHVERIKPGGKGGNLGYYTGESGKMATIAGHLFNMAVGRRAMGIDWMNKSELAEAVPPKYTEFIGRQLLTMLGPALDTAGESGGGGIAERSGSVGD